MSIEKFNLNQKVVGKVIGYTQPYFDVMVEEQLSRVFIKNMDTKFISLEEASTYIDQKLEFVIEEIVEHAKPHYPGLILNRRIIIEEQIKEEVAKLNVGDDLSIDKLVPNKGGFNFEYNNIRGFIPLSEVSYSFSSSSEVALENIELPVNIKVTSIDLIGGIYNIVGSIKANLTSPIEKIKDLNVGDVIQINSLEANKGGANFVYNDTRGFIPLKELSHQFNHEAQSVINELTFPIDVKVTEIENKGSFVNIIASIKALSKSPRELIEDLNVGDNIEISEFTPNAGGLSFEYKKVRGFIPLSEVSHKFYSTSDSALSEVTLPASICVSEISESRGQLNIIGSIKANLEDLFTGFINKNEIGNKVDAKIVRPEEYGYIIEFSNGYKTLLHISQFSEEIKAVTHEIGDAISVTIMDINEDAKQIQVTTLN